MLHSQLDITKWSEWRYQWFLGLLLIIAQLAAAAAALILIVYNGLPSPDTHSEIPPAARSICTLQLGAAGSQGPPGEPGPRPPQLEGQIC